MDRVERTVWLASLLRHVAKCFRRGALAESAAQDQGSETSADFVRAWQPLFARCVDADLLQALVESHTDNAVAPTENVRVAGISDSQLRALEAILGHAETLASGGRQEPPSSDDHPRLTRLASVFDHVQLCEPGPSGRSYLPHGEIGNLQTEPRIFPEGSPGRPDDLSAHMREFSGAFASLESRLDWDNFDCVYAHCFALLERFATSVATGTQEESPDASVFDHLRLAAAIAACLYRYHSATETLTDEAVRSAAGDARVALVVGDLSGIQDYLFAIASIGAGGVARRLRARSFFLQMLAEVACLKLRHCFGLPQANVIMSSGGKFYMLVPNTSQTTASLQDFQRTCDRWLLDRFHGELALDLAWRPMADGDFGAGGQGFGDALAELRDELSRRKARRLGGVLVDEGWREAEFLRAPFPAGSSACPCCGRFPAERKVEPDDPDEEAVCNRCYQDARLGSLLPRAEYVGFYDRHEHGTDCFDWTFRVASRPEQVQGATLVTRLNAPDLAPLAHVPAGCRYLVNHVPRLEDGYPATFGDIAGDGLLSVVKADVDYLGQVFQEGLRRDAPDPSFDTPSRIAALSRQMDTFFSAWMEWLLRTEFPQVYAVYSGGDDMLLVAPRAQTLPLVQRIRERFAEYTRNPEITLSVGVVVTKPRLPVAHTSRAADSALEAAKEAGRNRLCLLNQTVKWEDLSVMQSGVSLLEEAVPPSAFLHQLLQFGEMWRLWRQERHVDGLRFQPLLAYSLARNVHRQKQKELFEWGSRLISFPVDDDSAKEAKTMDLLGLIAKWVLLGRREKRDAENV